MKITFKKQPGNSSYESNVMTFDQKQGKDIPLYRVTKAVGWCLMKFNGDLCQLIATAKKFSEIVHLAEINYCPEVSHER